MSIELGGFAEYEEDIDGKFNTFNFCLAQEYASAIFCEDFIKLGEISCELIDKITYWMNYNGKIGKDDIEEIKGIKDGSIMTCNNRTFIDAIVAHKKYQLAETYMLRGIFDERLFTTYVMYAPDSEICFEILNYINSDYLNKEKYIYLLNSIFRNVDDEFLKIDDLNQQLLFLNRMKNIISCTLYPAEYGKITVSTKNYSWAKQLIKLNKTCQ